MNKFRSDQLRSSSADASSLCQWCDSEENTSNVVVSRGNPNAQIMIIGEAPGAMEDKLGIPFVGRSGRLLDLLLNKVGLDFEKDIYICNLMKCRPPNNRRPRKSEIFYSYPWLEQQINLVNPSIVLLMGTTVVEVFLKIKGGLTKIRGEWHHLDGRLFMPLFHPSYLLRNPSQSKGSPFSLTCQDLAEVKKKLLALN